MSEHLLNGTQVCPSLKQVSCKRMSQSVRTNSFLYSCKFFLIFFLIYYIFSDRGGKAVADKKTYIAIDLKSFYASVECVERCLDPLTTNLVVADSERTEKTIEGIHGDTAGLRL